MAMGSSKAANAKPRDDNKLTKLERDLVEAFFTERLRRKDFSKEALEREAQKLDRYITDHPDNPKTSARRTRLAEIDETLAVLKKLGM